MVYLGLLLLIFVALHFTKRAVGSALLVALAMTLVGNLVAGDLAQMLTNSGLKISAELALQLVKITLMVLPTVIVLIRSQKLSRRSLQMLFEAAILTGLVILTIHVTIGAVFKLDDLSLQIQKLVFDNQKWLIVAAGFWGFYQVILKQQDD